MKLVFSIVISAFLSVCCNGQGPYSFIAANNEEIEQPIFYYNSCVLIQHQELTEASIEEKLKGKWQCCTNKNWQFILGQDGSIENFTGLELTTEDTVRIVPLADTIFSKYFVVELTDKISNWDKYEGTGFYLNEIETKSHPVKDYFIVDGKKVYKKDMSYDSKLHAWELPMKEPKCDCSSQWLVFLGGTKLGEIKESTYKILEVYDNTLILSTNEDKVYVFSRVN